MTDSDIKLKASNKKNKALGISAKNKKIEQTCKTTSDINYIKQVVKILKDNNLAEIKYETEHSEIKIVASHSNLQQPISPSQTASMPQTVSAPQMVSVPQMASVSQQSSQAVPIPGDENHKPVTTVTQFQAVVANQSASASIQQDYGNHPGAVKSPMVGTCYLSPEPGVPTFVKTGDTVKKDQPLLIIEAMKVMNYIKAPKEGKIIHIAVEDAQPVEFGQLLMVID